MNIEIFLLGLVLGTILGDIITSTIPEYTDERVIPIVKIDCRDNICDTIYIYKF